MQRATRDQIQYAFDRHTEPVLGVASGEVLEVETEEPRTGKTLATETTTPEHVKSLRGKGTYCRRKSTWASTRAASFASVSRFP